MECEICQIPGRKKFYCEVCLNERLLIHKNALQRLEASLDTRVQSAAENLEAPGGVRERRILKARRDALISSLRCHEARQRVSWEQLELKKKIILDKRKQLDTRRTSIQAVRSRLQLQHSNLQIRANHNVKTTHSATCTALSCCTETSSQSKAHVASRIISIQKDWDRVLDNLASVRKKLIVQLCNIYTITADYTTTTQPVNPSSNPTRVQEQYRPRHPEQDSTKPSSVGKINQRLCWRILGLCLPVSTEIKSYHREQTSAATLYTAHLLRLIAMYLGVKLPFPMIMGPFLSIRAPTGSIWSNKHPSPYPLHIPSSMAYSSGSQVSQVAFLSGLCMLAINAHYLLLTQQPQLSNRPENPAAENSNEAVDLPKSGLSTVDKNYQASSSRFKPTEMLKNLYTLCSTRPIGHCSHLTGKNRLSRPDHLHNSDLVDLEELIKEVLQSKIDDSVDEGWSII